VSFVLLPPELHSTAVAAEKYFKQRGAKGFKYEEALDPSLKFVPTLSATLPDKTILCVEVSARAYNNTLDSFVMDAFKGGWPIQLWVAIPDAGGDNDFPVNLKRAKDQGVGVLLVPDKGAPSPYTSAVSLALWGLPPTRLEDFPKAKRPAVIRAEETFRNGDPNKGCHTIFEELEAVSRACAIATRKKGHWRQPKTGEKPPANLAAMPTHHWNPLLEEMHTFLEFNKVPKCPKLTKSLVAGTQALTDPRNQTAHKPRTLAELRKRDSKLRAWFESGREMLSRWYNATKALRL
jgi:hypothetical protein